MRLSSSPLLGLALVALLGWGFLDDLFGGERAPSAPAADEVRAHVEALVQGGGDAPARHPATAALYVADAPVPLWATRASRQSALALLQTAPADGLDDVGATAAERAAVLLDAAERAWAALDDDARDTLADPRPARIAALDLALSDGLLRYGDALRGARVDPAALYPGTWFPARRDTSGTRWADLVAAVGAGQPDRVARALGTLRPSHEGYRRLREALAALDQPLPPVPSGDALRPGGRSVRVPHLRGRLAAFGYLPTASTPGASTTRTSSTARSPAPSPASRPTTGSPPTACSTPGPPPPSTPTSTRSAPRSP